MTEPRPGLPAMVPTDALTGLPAHEALHSELERLVRVGEPFSLLRIDLDFFRLVNGDGLRERGNQMLRRTAQAVAAASPEGAPVFRCGGDEFAVLVATGAAPEAFEIGERICAAVAAIEVPASAEPDRAPPRLACSVGVARYPADGGTAPRLWVAAGELLFSAKHFGGGHAAVADTAIMPWLAELLDGLADEP